jgi:RND family efflux transporter MFP subunit
MAIEPSLDARLQLEQARSDRNASREDVARIQEQLKLQLATRQQLLQAQQRLRHVELLLESLIRRGVGSSRMLRASSPGVVNAIYVQPGKRVPADTPLMETVDNNQVAVRLGIESQDLGRLALGQVVRLSRVNASDERSMEGNVELKTHRVNPLTRLVDVLVKPPPGARLLLHEYMRGVIVVSSRNVLLAPRAAVLPEQGRHILFTVREGRAYKHVVEVGLENDKQVQVTGPGLQTGQLVVIEGNSQIRNGMAVKMGKQP